jgi:hypothetical protein
MAYTIKIGDVEVRCETAAEAVKLAETVKSKVGEKRDARRTDRREIEVGVESESPIDPAKFFRVIQAKGETGIGGYDLAQALGIEENLFGPYVAKLGKAVRERMGLSLNDLIARKRTSDGKRLWIVLPRAKTAIETLQTLSRNGTGGEDKEA